VKGRLVTVAHGSRNDDAQRAIRALLRQVARRLPEVEVVESYVELTEPSFASVMAASTEPLVVVPLLLSTGYHVNHDVPEAARLSQAPVTLARRLGPHPLLAPAAAHQLRAAGARRGDAVVLVVAGSTDPDATTDAVVAGRLLRAHWGAPVELGFLSGSGPTVPEAFERLRVAGHRRVVASPYLLAPGFFATRAIATARAQGASAVADVLAEHALVAELVVRRYRAAWRGVLGAGVPASAAGASRVA